MMNLNFVAFHIPFMDQSFVLLVIGLLLFGKRLPEVGRSLGQGIVQFKKGLQGIEEEVEKAVSTPATAPAVRVTNAALPQSTANASTSEGFKFDPITGQPLQPTPVIPAGAKFDPFTGKPIEEKQTESIGV
jgi:sec-independent protein translocase protein TatA